MKRDYEYIVLGLGGIGSGAAYWLARRAGGDVLGLEQFELGHARGASQDHSRIIRLSYHTPGYVELAKAAYQVWSAVEAEAQEQLVLKTGGLDLWPPGAAIPMSDYTNSLGACNVPFEVLDAAEIMRRWPQFCLSDDTCGLYQADGGLAAAAKANAAHQRLARAHGAVLYENMPVTSIRPINGEIEVVAAETAFRCRRLIVAAGAWTNQALAHFGRHLPLTITQEQVTYFATPHLANCMPDCFPVWIWMDEPSFYGFPVYGEPGIKVAQDVGGAEVTATTRAFTPDLAALERVIRFTKSAFSISLGDVLYTKTCLYTLTPDRDFVVDTLPDHPNVVVAIGAGHAFKFASLLGKILSEVVMDGKTESNVEPFQIDRPILLEENPQRRFMV